MKGWDFRARIGRTFEGSFLLFYRESGHLSDEIGLSKG
jgi:hypothetical protein